MTRVPMRPDWENVVPEMRNHDRAPPEITKPESCHGLAGIATRLLLLVGREPMRKRLAHGPVGDGAAVPPWPGRIRSWISREAQNKVVTSERAFRPTLGLRKRMPTVAELPELDRAGGGAWRRA